MTVGHRQGDLISLNVERINRGLGTHAWALKPNCFQYISEASAEEIQEESIREYERLVQQYGIENVKYLTATKQKSKVSTEVMNPILRELVNPTQDREAVSIGGIEFYVNDRVMYTKENNYDKNVFNGEIGTVVEINIPKKAITIAFDDGRQQEFRGGDLKNIELSYAQTINKSMGSECEATVIAYVVPPILWSRNLLYTAVSRAKKEVVLISTEKMIENSLASAAPIMRNTNLVKRVKGVKSK